MQKFTSLFLVVALAFLFSGFNSEKINGIVGTYGVSDNNPNGIQLTLNPNNTFHYKDFSNPNKKIDTHGEWKLENGKVILFNYESTHAFHNKWELQSDGCRIKSRKGLSIYTLVRN